jgi:hypothetical protein
MQVNNTSLTISFNRRLNQSNRTAVYLISQIRNPVSILIGLDLQPVGYVN